MASKNKGRSGKVSKTKQVDGNSTEKSAFSIPEIKKFFREVQSEFKKVVWPDKKVTGGLTGFVVVLVFVISLYLGSVDLLLGKLVSFVLQ